MAGVVRTMPSHASRSTSRVVKAPRPPNAWIIYRSDKVHELPPLEPGQPRRAQAEVSKMISNMWANESEATRQEYERRAEEAKAAHALKYPGYRFKPMKKEEKKAQREQEQNDRVAKRRDQRKSVSPPQIAPAAQRPSPLPQYHTSITMPINLPSPNQSFAAPLLYPIMPLYPSHARFGPAGPTPPLSAAGSPSSSSPSPEVLPNQSSETVDANPPDDNQNSGCAQASESSTATAFFPSFNLAEFTSEWPFGPTTAATNSGTLTPEVTPSPPWQFGSNRKGQGEAARTEPMETVPFNLDSFVLPDLEPRNDPLSAFMSATADPGIFQLMNVNPNELMAHPTGEIEVSLGDSLDLSLFPPGLFHGDPLSMSLPGSGSVALGELCGASNDMPPGSSSSYNLNDYFDFNTFGEGGETMNSNERYVPPAGACNSSHRRVGGSWKRQFVNGN